MDWKDFWIKTTDIILIAAIAMLVLFACLGIYQWVTRKSLKKVDKQLLWMPLPIIMMAFVYLLFDKILPLFISNWPLTRPDGSGEPSFPSTHVMIVTTIFFCCTAAISKYVKNKNTVAIIDVVMLILVSLVSTGRILSNKHSLLDVIGGIVFALIFYEFYYARIRKKKTKKEEPENE